MNQIRNGFSFRIPLRRRRNPVKLTALLYFREALLAERYEECPDFIAVAKEFGAQDFEIKAIIEDPRRIPRP